MIPGGDAKAQRSIGRNSTARQLQVLDFWGRRLEVYANANLSIYSGQACNAACPFCVEEITTASRGTLLTQQKTIEPNDQRYFATSHRCSRPCGRSHRPCRLPGGEPSKDPRLPQLLRLVAGSQPRKSTVTTNGSGLLDLHQGRRMIDWIAEAEIDHLNISVAASDPEQSSRLMRLPTQLSPAVLAEIVRVARQAGIRVRLSCVLLKCGTAELRDVLCYLDFARTLQVDNVIFRQLMKTEPASHAPNYVVRYSDSQRVALEPLLDEISRDARFRFVRQILGYYYYVEVWQYQDMDVVFEEADLAQLEAVKRRDPFTIHELVFHPNANLASTWQPWDGVLGPPG